MPLRLAPLPLLAALLAPACAAADNPDRVRDTLGHEYAWVCNAGACRVAAAGFSPPVPAECGDEALYVLGAGGLAILCVATDPDIGAVHTETCRPVACSIDPDCPQWSERPYICLEGICQVLDTTGLTLDRLDITALCLARTPRAATCGGATADPAVAERLALVDTVCGEVACTAVPDPCLPPPPDA